MINIIIDGEYKLYNHGLKLFLSSIFMERHHKNSRFFNSLDNENIENIENADIIAIPLEAGDKYICHPLLKARKKNSLIIGLYDRESQNIPKRLPHCLKKSLFINRNENLANMRKTILQHWELRNTSIVTDDSTSCNNCNSCRYLTLSPQQISVAERYFTGQSILDIALELDLSRKTILSHKHMLMRKFDLVSDYELINFLRRVDLPANIPGIFRGCTKKSDSTAEK